MGAVDALTKAIQAYERTPHRQGVKLRLDLADIMMRRLDELGWTQKQFAEKAGMKEAMISRLIHAASN